MPKYCPECENEIGHLKYNAYYSESGSEWGTCDLNGDNREETDRECNDGDTSDYEFLCPECEHQVNPDDLLDYRPGEDPNEDEDDDEDEEVNVTETEDIINDTATIVRASNDYVDGTQQRKINGSIECPECHHIVFRSLNESAICENCNHEIE